MDEGGLGEYDEPAATGFVYNDPGYNMGMSLGGIGEGATMSLWVIVIVLLCECAWFAIGRYRTRTFRRYTRQLLRTRKHPNA